jgi:hypothetical protein
MAPAGGSCRESGNSLMIIDHHHWYHHIIVRLWSWVLITICVWTVCQCAEIVEDSRPKTVVESNDLVQPSLCASIIRGNGYPCEEITVNKQYYSWWICSCKDLVSLLQCTASQSRWSLDLLLKIQSQSGQSMQD